MKNVNFLLLLLLLAITGQLRSQELIEAQLLQADSMRDYKLFPVFNSNPFCSTENALFGAGEANPFGLSDNGEDDPIIIIHMLDVDRDGREDAFVTDMICTSPACGGIISETRYFRNIGEGQPEFVLETVFENSQPPFGWPGIPNVDIDGDCDLDIVRGWFFEPEPGDSSNIINVVFYENKAADNGDPNGFDFTSSVIEVNPWGIELPVSPITGNSLGLIWPSFGDLDGDGDLDMFPGGFFPGQPDESYIYFENIGSASEPAYAEAVFNPFGLDFHCCNHYSRLVDIDCDGDLDMFTEHADGPGSLIFQENIGTPAAPDFNCDPVLYSDFDFNPVYGVFRDLNGDVQSDAITGGDAVRYFENITDGLVCEDLSPVSLFSAVIDGLTYTFANNALGDDLDYHWNFGDGEISTEPAPVYTYAENGMYEVCLTVSNAYGCHTLCQEVDAITGTAQKSLLQSVSIAPNPAGDFVRVNLTAVQALGEVEMVLLDPLGRQQRMYALKTGARSIEQRINLNDLPAGVYTLKISVGKEIVYRTVMHN